MTNWWAGQDCHKCALWLIRHSQMYFFFMYSQCAKWELGKIMPSFQKVSINCLYFKPSVSNVQTMGHLAQRWSARALVERDDTSKACCSRVRRDLTYATQRARGYNDGLHNLQGNQEEDKDELPGHQVVKPSSGVLVISGENSTYVTYTTELLTSLLEKTSPPPNFWQKKQRGNTS